MTQKPILCFKCDWYAPSPLWLAGRPADPASLGLDPALAAELLELQAFFDREQSPASGWRSTSSLRTYDARRIDLRERLAAALGDRYEVVERYL